MAANPSPNVFALRIALLDHRPEIWRRLLVPGSVRLDRLHLIFQEAMGWTNSHLHQFRIGNALYGTHFDEWPDEELHEVEFKLADVAQHADSNVDPRNVFYRSNQAQDVAFQQTFDIYLRWVAKNHQ